MGRWGWHQYHCLFEGDQDFDAVLTLTKNLGIDGDFWEYSLSAMVHQTDMLAPADVRALYSTAQYANSLANDTIPYIREKFDTDNLGERFFAACRAKENDTGDFLTPGKAQFLAALDHHEPGVARSFQEPSCFKCGRIEAGIGHKPLQCKKCKVATYCGKDCQRDQWREHRVSCVPPRQRFILNV
ncbi:Zinc finger MYND-type [Penicillium fimorum]|uniref:Zinc finger MYND-type n=1 Tax=Penicillium fimorum TaxID=1882269 RepID=A0A9W9XKD2_9EURO|nr:Zinc finger MYND-type [Penicillium fimorum]